MGAQKKTWLWPLLALCQLVVIIILASARCGHDTADKKPASANECPPASNSPNCPSCPNQRNITEQSSNETDDSDAGEAEPAPSSAQNAPRRCYDAEHGCGWGYECIENQCRKLDGYCSGHADCDPGLVCDIVEDYNWETYQGKCKPWQCDTEEQCNQQCGIHCVEHRCEKMFCCADADCPIEEVCVFQGKNDDGAAFGLCRSRELTENGNCLADEHCPAGQVCYGFDRCLPATCDTNSDCGCETVCRKGHCELGCDDNSGCCNEGDVCDRGSCINPNEEEEE